MSGDRWGLTECMTKWIPVEKMPQNMHFINKIFWILFMHEKRYIGHMIFNYSYAGLLLLCMKHNVLLFTPCILYTYLEHRLKYSRLWWLTHRFIETCENVFECFRIIQSRMSVAFICSNSSIHLFVPHYNLFVTMLILPKYPFAMRIWLGLF